MTSLQVWVLRPVRYLFVVRNPMARRTDRAESVVALWLLFVFVVSIVLAVCAGESAYEAKSADAASAQASGRYTDAVLLAPAATAGGYDNWFRARWIDQDGGKHVADVPVGVNAKAGSTVRIWLDHHGNRTTPPSDSAAVAAESVGLGLLIVGGAALVLESIRRAARSALNRIRLADWEAEWERVGPRWSRPGR